MLRYQAVTPETPPSSHTPHCRIHSSILLSNMADDDCIQFLGMKAAAPRVTLPSPLFLNSQRPVTGGWPYRSLPHLSPLTSWIGVVLELEKSATEVGHGMIFHKSDSPVVHIGRRPGSDSEKRRNEPGKAFFSCPVVSRHHAKLAFSDSGHVRLHIARH